MYRFNVYLMAKKKKKPTLFTLICPVPRAVLVLFSTKCLWEEGKKGKKDKRKGESINETVKIGREKEKESQVNQRILVSRKPIE